MRTVCNLTMTIHCTRVQLIPLWEVSLPLLFLCTSWPQKRIPATLQYSVPIASVQIWVGAICRSQQERKLTDASNVGDTITLHYPLYVNCRRLLQFCTWCPGELPAQGELCGDYTYGPQVDCSWTQQPSTGGAAIDSSLSIAGHKSWNKVIKSGIG